MNTHAHEIFYPLQEALLIELRHMNEEVSGKQKDGDTIKDSDHFKKQYAMVLVQLRDANDQVCLSMKFHPFIGFYSFLC